ncbi:hypothetical protein OOJ91_34260 [Micromonospora lupini]|uniref:hypothetical protein n=1 Tax=Micromonospora lupini TaxID=285679 RepID=UPI002256F88C|nr:hypothetical protein [Micromonospora lupini]MCX5070914.1 hypothetical protein [Micromonospora lupini]
MSATTVPFFAVDDFVVVKPEYARKSDKGVVYKVVRVMPVNLLLEPVGGGPRVRANPTQVDKAPASMAAEAAARAVAAPVVGPLPLAKVVMVSGLGWKEPVERLYVVIKDNGDQVNVAVLGGDEEKPGRYWRVPRPFIKPVEIESVALKPRQEAVTGR